MVQNIYFVTWWKGISFPKFKTVQLSCTRQSPPQTTSYNDRLYRTHVTESFGSQINKIISQLFNFPLHIRYTQIVVFSLKNNVYLCSHTVYRLGSYLVDRYLPITYTLLEGAIARNSRNGWGPLEIFKLDFVTKAKNKWISIWTGSQQKKEKKRNPLGNSCGFAPVKYKEL